MRHFITILSVVAMLVSLSLAKGGKKEGRPSRTTRDSETGLPLPGSKDNKPDRKMGQGRSKLEINGKSGRLVLYRSPPSSAGNGTMPKHPVVIRLHSLAEVDSAGSEICSTGNQPHSVNSFAGMNFTYSTPDNITIPHSSITANHVSLSTNVPSYTSRLTLDVYMPFSSGDVTLGTEVNSVNVGEMKFSLTLDRWQWCSSAATHIDIAFAISSKDKPKKSGTKENRRPSNFDLGNQANMTLSQMLYVDGAFVALDSAYPEVSVKGKHNVFLIRVPRFTSSAVYDPSVSTGSDDYYNAGRSLVPTCVVWVVLCVWFFVASL